MIKQEKDISLIDFIKEVEQNDMSDYIFRGQTNSFFKSNFKEWKIVSSYNRNTQFDRQRFSSFLSQQLDGDLFRIYYQENKFVEKNKLDRSDLISKLYFLQHYGIPTCLIDFSHDPLIALYFAMSSLPSRSGGAFNKEGFPIYYPQEYTISIFRINHKLIIEHLNLHQIDNNLPYEYFKNYTYTTMNDRKRNVIVGIDLNPVEKNSKLIDNYNLKAQKGAFILYDNSGYEDYGLEEFLFDYIQENEIELNEPIVKVYKIKYNELYKPMHSRQPNFKSAFQILEEKQKTGKFIFNDYQGLKYDFTFFHN